MISEESEPVAIKPHKELDGLEVKPELIANPKAKQYLRSHPKQVTLIYVATFAVLFSLQCTGAGGRIGNLPTAFILIMGCYLLLWWLTLIHEWDIDLFSDWDSFLENSRKQEFAAARAHLSRVVSRVIKNEFILRILGFSALTIVAANVVGSVHSAYAAGGLGWVFFEAVLISLLPPGLSFLALWLNQKLKSARIGTQPRSKFFLPAARSLSFFLACRCPYLGAYFGFLTFILIVSFAPVGLGYSVAQWLQACLRDANIAHDARVGIYAIVVSTCSALVLYNFTAGLAIRLSAAFQVFANRVLVYRDSVLDALIETSNIRSTKVLLPERNPGVQNILALLWWLVFCYLVLFALVAFCPDPLGSCIGNWLWASLRDAGIDINLYEHINLRVFLGSIIAGYGAVPIAIMSCAFLGNKKPRSLIVSSQGILCPSSKSNLAGLSPLKPWCDLHRLSIKPNKGSEQGTLTLAFKWPDKITLSIAELEPLQLAELLTAADEYATACKFDPAVIDLIARLSKEVKVSSVTEIQRFASTIFSPRKGGDRLNGNKYRVVRKLAGKAMSAVYLARDKQDKLVVIKEFVLPTAARQRDELVKSLEREFNILRGLQRESIAQVKDWFEEGKDAASQSSSRFIVMEYVQGCDLRSIVERRGCRSNDVVRRWALEIARIMQYLHQQDPPVVHRDLTPDNLMEDLDGRIKLIDFGAAHQFIEGVTGTLIGKQCYIAPEQLRGKPTTRSDIYSFGGTLYFLLTGSDPAALQKCDRSEAPFVSHDLIQLIMKCTDFEESRRYHSFSEIIAELEKSGGVRIRTMEKEKESLGVEQ